MTPLKEYRLSDLMQIKYGKDHKHLADGSFPLYGSGGIMRYVEKPLYDDESILIPRKGTLSNLFYLDQPFWSVDTMFYSIINKDLLIPKYLFYTLQTFDLASLNVGSAVPSLTTEVLNEVLVSIPDLPNQTLITEILSSLDDKIELNNKINQELENLAQTLFKRWFVDFEFPNENGEPYKSSGGEMVDSELGEIPKGWGIRTLKDEFIINMGQSPKGDTYNDNGDGIIFFQGRSDFGFRFPSPRMYTSDPKKIAQKFETLISVRAPVGDINMAETQCCIGRGIGAISHSEKLFSYTYYKILSIQDELKSYDNEGTVFGSINKETLGNIKTIIPQKQIANDFNELVSEIDFLISNNIKEYRELTNLRDTLLPKLISGELEVQEVLTETT
jgi:type I restriction enzyme S subunit